MKANPDFTSDCGLGESASRMTALPMSETVLFAMLWQKEAMLMPSRHARFCVYT